MDKQPRSKKGQTDSKQVLRTSSSESQPSKHSDLTLGPDAKEIDFSAVSTDELMKEMKRRFAGFLFITYEHTERPEGTDGGVWIHGSGTVIRGLKDCLNDEVNAAIYGEPDRSG